MSDDDDASALSHITSKMPTPPPRPSSIASSTRSSSKRSSTASSFHRQLRHASIGPDGEPVEAPPTPSVSSRYTSVTLFDELDPFSSNITERPISMTTPPRLMRIKSSSSGLLHSGKRRNSRAIKERGAEGPASIIAARSPNVAPQMSTKDDTAPTSSDQSSRIISPRKGPAKGRIDIERLSAAVSPFLSDLARTCILLLQIVIWPVMMAVVDSIAGYYEMLTVGEAVLVPSSQRIEDPSAYKSLEKTFAERFKYIVCTSFLLTNRLSISNYDQKSSTLSSTPAKKDSTPDQPKPASKAEPRSVTVVSSNPHRSRSTLHLSSAGNVLLDAAIIAAMAVLPYAGSWQAWMRSIVCLISLVWGILAAIGMDEAGGISFETSHRPIGTYKLVDIDMGSREGDGSNPVGKASQMKDNMCDEVTALIKACKDFDIECNKAIAAVQEVELVSRGFKLSHPLPPISRIEANSTMMSPPRLRNGSWQGVTSNLSATRLSRSSSSGATASSNWKHQGTQPQSILFNSGSVSPANRSISPLEAEVDTVRMVSLRKTLVMSFEEAKGAISQAVEGLAPLVDADELKLLQDMYELDRSQDDTSVPTSVDLAPLSSTRTTLAEKRSSWVPMARLKLGDEPISPTSIDEGDRPSTPQRFSLLFDNSFTGNSARKRDSGLSETWSVASPSRESQTVRGGSRLGYISDKASVNSTTPNQTAESKRLSYISSAPSATSPLQGKPFALQQTMPAMSSHRKRGSLLHSGILDELKQPTNALNSAVSHSKTDAFLITSLKTSFEKVHLMRRKVLCHLLALDFALDGVDSVEAGAAASATKYWANVSRLMKQLTRTMRRLTGNCTERLEKEMAIGQRSSIDALPISPLDANEQPAQDYTGVEDRMTAMSLSLRSIQVKMMLCAKDLKVKSPPSLHGTNATLPGDDSSDKSERLFETIREDLLTLSAEWENALKIIRCHSSSTVGDTTSSTINSSRLDSPQEAEEDALRQWVQARRREDETSDSEDERAASRIIESGLLQWSGLESKEGSKWQDNGNLSDLLIKTATPDHLPPTGLEKVYESVGEEAEQKRQKSLLSRQERIRLAKLEREEAKDRPATTDLDVSTHIMEELQAVMKNRKSLKAGLPSPSRSTPLASTDEKQAAFAF